jgi:tRNA(fMet)-specific endonuclease VapC
VTHLDTSFLVDLLRETAKGSDGPARRKLTNLADEELWVSVHVACELRAGAELSTTPEVERAKVDTLLGGVQIAYPDERFAPAYGRLLAWLRKRGDTIATMDLLIATAAIVDSAPIVTRNTKHFSRVPGLVVIDY